MDKKDIESVTIREEAKFNLQYRVWLNKGECSQQFSYISPPSPSKITMIMNTKFSGSSQILSTQSNLEENEGCMHNDKFHTRLMSFWLENHKYREKLSQKLKGTRSKLRHEHILFLNSITEQEQTRGFRKRHYKRSIYFLYQRFRFYYTNKKY